MAACSTAPTATVSDDDAAAGNDATLEATVVPEVPDSPPPLPSDKPEAPALATIPLEDLVGVGDSQVLAMLGEPDLTEDRAPGVAWIYEGANCRFSLLLYPDLETNTRTVLSVETDGDAPCSAHMAQP